MRMPLERVFINFFRGLKIVILISYYSGFIFPDFAIDLSAYLHLLYSAKEEVGIHFSLVKQ